MGGEAIMSDANQIKILSGGAMKSLMVEVVPLFERANGARVEIRFALTSVLKKEIEDGAAFDIALLPRPELDALVPAGKIAAGTQTDITRSAVGLAVRAGAPKPDIGTVDALRRTLQQARTIGYSDGPSGAYIADLLVRLGIADEMKPKTRLTSRPVAEIVAEGEAEVGMQQIVAILPVKALNWSVRCRANCRTLLSMRPASLPAAGNAGLRAPWSPSWPRPRWCA
jgi:molybdate transport system substrate-binding protein